MSELMIQAFANHLTPRKRTRPAKLQEISSVAQYIEYITNLKKKDLPTAFRGQKNISWKGKAPIHRPKERLDGVEHKMVRELISIHPQEFQQDSTMFDRLVRMQHYGLPTRLLDVTLNPLVALFFAAQDFTTDEVIDGEIVKTPRDGKVSLYTIPEERIKFYDSDTVACLSNLANLSYELKEEIQYFGNYDYLEEFNNLPSIKELVRYINREKPNFAAKINPITLFKPVFVRPKNNNRRIIAQAGAFLVHGLESKDLKYDTNISQISLRILADKKSDIRDELSIIGINISTLFPELDKAAEIISYRYKKDLATYDISDLI
ncbi:FRG domain-containing protein (plasmid) [Brucella pituitosa]|uniref:FRG domain-containing protein n=1 Tax=Brucella pituitosa TaxID=571256 RepID=UPI003C77E9CB